MGDQIVSLFDSNLTDREAFSKLENGRYGIQRYLSIGLAKKIDIEVGRDRHGFRTNLIENRAPRSSIDHHHHRGT